MTRARRGSLLLVVAVLVIVCALLAAAVVSRVRTESMSGELLRRQMQLREVAWSGVRAAMAIAAAQRRDVLSGESLDLPESAVIFEDATSGERGVAYFGPEEPQAAGGQSREGASLRAAPQAACININTSDTALFVRLGLSQSEADAIVSARPAGGFGLIEDVKWPAASGEAGGAGEGGEAKLSPSMMTTASWDCQVPGVLLNAQSGAALTRRMKIGGAVNEESRKSFESALPPELAALAVPWVSKPEHAEARLGAVVSALAGAGVSARQIGSVLNVLTADAAEYPAGKIDALRASAQVLASVPGIDASLAEKLVSVRGALDAAARSDLAWPLTQGVLTAEQFAQAVDSLTNRSLQWRVKVRAVVESGRGGQEAGGLQSEVPRGMVFDVILDLAGPTVRVVSMHESTWLTVAEGIRSSRLKAASESAIPSVGADVGGMEGAAEGVSDASENVPPPPPSREGSVTISQVDERSPSENNLERGDGVGVPGGRFGRWRVDARGADTKAKGRP